MEQSNSYQDFFKTLNILHLSLITGVALFCAVVYFGGMATPDDEMANMFKFIIPGVAAMSLVMGRIATQPILQKAKQESTLMDKLNVFRNASIIRWALMEGASLFAVIGFMLSGQMVFLAVALAGMAYIFTLRPTPEKAAADLGLTDAEYREISS